MNQNEPPRVQPIIATRGFNTDLRVAAENRESKETKMKLLTRTEAAGLLRCSRNHLSRLGIERVRLGRRVLYENAKLEAYVTANSESVR